MQALKRIHALTHHPFHQRIPMRNKLTQDPLQRGSISSQRKRKPWRVGCHHDRNMRLGVILGKRQQGEAMSLTNRCAGLKQIQNRHDLFLLEIGVGR
jgi:hypothetical protein